MILKKQPIKWRILHIFGNPIQRIVKNMNSLFVLAEKLYNTLNDAHLYFDLKESQTQRLMVFRTFF